MSDTKEEIFCPACKTKMTKIKTSIGINVDVCSEGCGGIWFDNRELEKFDENSENIDDIQKVLYGKTFLNVDKDNVRYCPVCNAKMVKHQPSKDCEIEIDECYSCGGKFLDYGELDKIRASKNEFEEQVNKFVKAMYNNPSSNSPFRANEATVKTFLKSVYTNHLK